MLTPLIIAVVLAVGALAFVIAPLLLGSPASAIYSARRRLDWETTDATDGRHATEPSAVDVLREIEFDRETGKLSETDYATLKATYAPRALAELRAARRVIASPPHPIADRLASAGVTSGASSTTTPAPRPFPTCATCGTRPERDAIYCSTCARYLTGQCGSCGAPVTAPAARHCSACGIRLTDSRPSDARELSTAG